MKKIITLGFALFLNSISAQVNIDFNTQPFPSDWTMQGGFEVLDYGIQPKCHSNALTGSFFTENETYWIQTASYSYNGGNVEINLTHGIKDLYNALGVYAFFHKPQLSIEYAEGNTDTWVMHEEIDLESVTASSSCLEYSTTIQASDLVDFESIKYRLKYVVPTKQADPFLLYWSIDKLQIEEQNPLSVKGHDLLEAKAYPNPVKDILNISSEREISEIEIFNLLGQNVFSKKISSKDTSINVSELHSGNYIVSIKGNSSSKSIKFFKI